MHDMMQGAFAFASELLNTNVGEYRGPSTDEASLAIWAPERVFWPISLLGLPLKIDIDAASWRKASNISIVSGTTKVAV